MSQSQGILAMLEKLSLPPALFAASVVSMAGLALVLPGPVWLSGPARVLGLAIMLAGAALSITAARHVMRQGTPVRPRQTPSCLVADGPFRWTRNPMYLGLSVGLAGFAVLLGTVMPVLVVPVFVILVERLHIRVEEAVLRERFPEAFAAYTQQTRRWL